MNVSKLATNDNLTIKINTNVLVEGESLEGDFNLVEIEFSSDNDEIEGHSPSGYRKTHSDDNVGAFFKEMARYPLLKAEEEVELAHRVKYLVEAEENRQKLQETLERKPTKLELAKALGLETERQLEHRLYLGRVAKRKMIRSNLRLVVSIAKRYLNRGVPFFDELTIASIINLI